MSEATATGSERPGRYAARHVAGLGAVEFVAVQDIIDILDRPAYRP